MEELINNQSENKILDLVKKNQRYYNEELEIIDGIFLKERGYITKIDKKMVAVVLVSGGLDSSIMLGYLIEKYNIELYPLFILRGARAEKYELRAAQYYIDFYQKRYEGKMHDIYTLSVENPPHAFKKSFPRERTRAIGHPLRNSTMQNFALMYATYLNGVYNTKITTILIGTIGDDGACPELSLLSLRSQMLNVCINVGDWNWQIVAPLIDTRVTSKIMYKKDLIAWAINNKVPLDKTRTCVSDLEISDGTCKECLRRLAVFDSLGIKDPIKYME